VKKVQFAAGELSLLRRVLGTMALQTDRVGYVVELHNLTKQDYKARDRILEKLVRAEQPSDPGVNAPAIEEALITYAGAKVAPLALPNWQRYARQGAAVGATVADAQIIGQWMSRQGWIQPGSQTLQSVLNNWSSWLGKARAAEGPLRPEAGLGNASIPNHLGQGPDPQRQVIAGGRPKAGLR
jgi:hypothetical protein